MNARARRPLPFAQSAMTTTRETLYKFLLAHCPNEAAALADVLAPLADQSAAIQLQIEQAWDSVAPHMPAEQRAAIGAAMIAANGNAERARDAAALLNDAANEAPYL